MSGNLDGEDLLDNQSRAEAEIQSSAAQSVQDLWPPARVLSPLQDLPHLLAQFGPEGSIAGRGEG
jgi:hypothetical protein